MENGSIPFRPIRDVSSQALVQSPVRLNATMRRGFDAELGVQLLQESALEEVCTSCTLAWEVRSLLVDKALTVVCACLLHQALVASDTALHYHLDSICDWCIWCEPPQGVCAYYVLDPVSRSIPIRSRIYIPPRIRGDVFPPSPLWSALTAEEPDTENPLTMCPATFKCPRVWGPLYAAVWMRYSLHCPLSL